MSLRSAVARSRAFNTGVPAKSVGWAELLMRTFAHAHMHVGECQTHAVTPRTTTTPDRLELLLDLRSVEAQILISQARFLRRGCAERMKTSVDAFTDRPRDNDRHRGRMGVTLRDPRVSSGEESSRRPQRCQQSAESARPGRKSGASCLSPA